MVHDSASLCREGDVYVQTQVSRQRYLGEGGDGRGSGGSGGSGGGGQQLGRRGYAMR